MNGALWFEEWNNPKKEEDETPKCTGDFICDGDTHHIIALDKDVNCPVSLGRRSRLALSQTVLANYKFTDQKDVDAICEWIPLNKQHFKMGLIHPGHFKKSLCTAALFFVYSDYAHPKDFEMISSTAINARAKKWTNRTYQDKESDEVSPETTNLIPKLSIVDLRFIQPKQAFDAYQYLSLRRSNSKMTWIIAPQNIPVGDSYQDLLLVLQSLPVLTLPFEKDDQEPISEPEPQKRFAETTVKSSNVITVKAKNDLPLVSYPVKDDMTCKCGERLRKADKAHAVYANKIDPAKYGSKDPTCFCVPCAMQLSGRHVVKR